MRYIYEPGQGIMMALTPTEAKVIADFLSKQIPNIDKKCQYFTDIHNSGEATTRQQDKMEYYDNLKKIVERFIKLEQEQ